MSRIQELLDFLKDSSCSSSDSAKYAKELKILMRAAKAKRSERWEKKLLKIDAEVLVCGNEIAKFLTEIGELDIKRLDNDVTLSIHKLRLIQEASRLYGKSQGLQEAKEIILRG